MKKRMLTYLFFAFVVLTSATYNSPPPAFSAKVYGNMANYFENEADLLAFFEFNKNEVVAEVGANKGHNIAGLSILTDSMTFYAQDINAGTLNQKDFDKLIKSSYKYKKSRSNTFHLCIGTEQSTQLPDSAFDKIILSSTFHEFTFMDEMVSDLSKKLKPNGKLYILESQCYARGHKNLTAEETTLILKKHHFRLLKKDGRDLNGANGLYRAVYAKEKGQN